MALREYARTKFAEIFDLDLDSGMVQNAEKGVYNYAVQDCRERNIECSWTSAGFKSAYKHKLNALLLNLKDPSNPDFLRHVLDKEVECKHLAFLKPEDINPTKWREIHARVAKRFPTSDPVEIPESALLQCSRCKSRRCTFYQLQTRSADEPLSTANLLFFESPIVKAGISSSRDPSDRPISSPAG